MIQVPGGTDKIPGSGQPFARRLLQPVSALMRRLFGSLNGKSPAIQTISTHYNCGISRKYTKPRSFWYAPLVPLVPIVRPEPAIVFFMLFRKGRLVAIGWRPAGLLFRYIPYFNYNMTTVQPNPRSNYWRRYLKCSYCTRNIISF